MTLLKNFGNVIILKNATYDWACVNPYETRCHQLHLLPEIHKALVNPSGTPIISCCNGPTENLSKLVASWLQISVENLNSFVKDSTYMLQMINNWNLLYGPFDPSLRTACYH